MKCFIISISIVFLLVLERIRGQILQFGECPEVNTMPYFNLDKFLGKWYEIERYPAWYEDSGLCAFKSINACGRNIEIEHGFIRDGVQYILHVNSTYFPGADAVFEINVSNIDPIGIPLNVIHTDYNNYAVVYGCKNNSFLGVRYISAWILARQKTLSEEILNLAHQQLNAVPNVYLAYLEPVPQEEADCKYRWSAHVDAENRETGDVDVEIGGSWKLDL